MQAEVNILLSDRMTGEVNRQKILKAKKIAVAKKTTQKFVDWTQHTPSRNILQKADDCQDIINKMDRTIYGKGKRKLMTYRNFMVS